MFHVKHIFTGPKMKKMKLNIYRTCKKHLYSLVEKKDNKITVYLRVNAEKWNTLFPLEEDIKNVTWLEKYGFKKIKQNFTPSRWDTGIKIPDTYIMIYELQTN